MTGALTADGTENVSLKDEKFIKMQGFRCPKCNVPRFKILSCMKFSDGREVPEHMMCYSCNEPDTLDDFQSKVPPGAAATWNERKMKPSALFPDSAPFTGIE